MKKHLLHIVYVCTLAVLTFAACTGKGTCHHVRICLHRGEWLSCHMPG